MSQPLSGRIAFVTGASRGIGRAVALDLAKAGATILAMGRTQGALEELDDAIRAIGGTCSLVVEDLTDFDKIDHMGSAIYKRFGKLDILVGAAGALGPLSPIGHIDPAVFNQVMNVNVTANYRLLRSFDPLLRQSDAGRVIMVSSGAPRSRRAYWGLYGASKAALETMTLCYAREVASTPVKVNVVDPGAVRTAMRAEAFPGEDPMSLKTPEEVAGLFLELADPACTRTGEIIQAY